MGIVIVGLTVVSLESILGETKQAPQSEQNANDSSSMMILGILAMVVGQFFHALQSIYEEYIL